MSAFNNRGGLHVGSLHFSILSNRVQLFLTLLTRDSFQRFRGKLSAKREKLNSLLLFARDSMTNGIKFDRNKWKKFDVSRVRSRWTGRAGTVITCSSQNSLQFYLSVPAHGQEEEEEDSFPLSLRLSRSLPSPLAKFQGR